MRKLKMNSTLLNVLSLLKSRQLLAVNEQMLGLDGGKGWPKSLRDYYYALPKELTTDLGLMRNECCINAIERLQIPEEWLVTNTDELDKFEFNY
ncbi:hypothetical protein [Photobacterium leiognathi]|uniref:hypothetical protein n=1 Tax=Photobacterium leiognathi TaxID=553611 RepID=UPI002981010D|nr:hypothetical protein [Photobacterium leiognathi]